MKKVARKYQVSEVAFDGPVWVGVDVHKKSYSIAITDKQGVSRVFSMAADENGLAARLQRLPNPVACGV